MSTIRRIYLSPTDRLTAAYIDDPLASAGVEITCPMVYHRAPDCPYVMVEARVVGVEPRYSHERTDLRSRAARRLAKVRDAWKLAFAPL